MKLNISGLTLLYLGSPLLVFFATWYKWPFAILAIGSLMTISFFYVKNEKQKVWFSKQTLLIIFSLAFFYTIISGIGEFTYQRADFIKHNLIATDLSQNSWPVNYSQMGSHLNYALGYYLNPAVLGKIIGLGNMRYVFFVWSWLGLGLIFLWLKKLIGGKYYLLFFWFAFLDIGIGLYNVLSGDTGWQYAFIFDFENSINYNLGLLQYTSPISAYNWVPQHALPAYLGAAMVFNYIKNRTSYYALLLMAIAIFIWSPFALLGLLPFLIYVTLKLRERKYVLPIFISLLPTLLLIFYFLAHVKGDGISANIPESFNSKHLAALFSFILFDGIFLLSLLYFFSRTNKDLRTSNVWPIFTIALCCLICLPLLRYGRYNDLLIRSSFPAIFFMFLLFGFFLQNSFVNWKGLKRYLALLLFAMCLFVPVKEHIRWAYYLVKNKHNNGAIANTKHYNLPELREVYNNAGYTIASKDFTQQYLGTDQSIYGKYLKKK